MRSITKFRSVIIELMDGLMMSWIRETPDLSDSLTREPRILLCHHCDVVLLVEVFLEVDHFLVRQPIEQIETVHTSLISLWFLNQSCQVLM